MLTLMRALKEKYGELMEQEDDPIVIIGKTIPYLKEVLDKTPEMLPVLKQAGVIDSGGAGFVVFIQGVCREFQHNGFQRLPFETIDHCLHGIYLKLLFFEL
jgi:dihydroxyacetone kinase-like predicted kinase